jgi:ketosteroid isomerase-like protein
MRTDVTQTILEAYDSWWRGDTASALQCFHPEAVVTVAGNPAKVPFAGEYRGHEGVAAFLARFAGGTPVPSPTLCNLLVDGDRAVVRWTMPVATAAASAELQVVDVVRLQQALIVTLEEVFDTGAVAQLFGSRSRSRSAGAAGRKRKGAAAASSGRPGAAGASRKPAPSSTICRQPGPDREKP